MLLDIMKYIRKTYRKIFIMRCVQKDGRISRRLSADLAYMIEGLYWDLSIFKSQEAKIRTFMSTLPVAITHRILP